MFGKLTASRVECSVWSLTIEEGHGKTGGKASKVVRTALPAPEEMQGQLGWFSLKERCLQGNLIDPPVHMRVIKETAGLLTVWGGRTSSKWHKLKHEKLKYPGSATSCPERIVLGDFQDQSRQHLV